MAKPDAPTRPKKRPPLTWVVLGGLALLTLYLLYRTTRAEVPGALTPEAALEIPEEDVMARRARAWLESAQSAEGEEQYAEGEIEPAMQGVQLVPQTMHQGRREEEEKPEVLPEPLAAVLAAVEAPFRRTVNAYPSFVVSASFVLTTAEPKLGTARTTGQVDFIKDPTERIYAKYDVLTDSQTSRLNKPLYRSTFWLIGNDAFIQRPDGKPRAISEDAPLEDQELLNEISSGSAELLSHELLRRWVKEAKFGVGYDYAGTDRWEGRPVDIYRVAPPHYGDNPNFQIHTREGTIWIDREHHLPLRADLLYTARLSIPSGKMYHYETTQKFFMEVRQIETAPVVAAPTVEEEGR